MSVPKNKDIQKSWEWPIKLSRCPFGTRHNSHIDNNPNPTRSFAHVLYASYKSRAWPTIPAKNHAFENSISKEESLCFFKTKSSRNKIFGTIPFVCAISSVGQEEKNKKKWLSGSGGKKRKTFLKKINFAICWSKLGAIFFFLTSLLFKHFFFVCVYLGPWLFSSWLLFDGF